MNPRTKKELLSPYSSSRLEMFELHFADMAKKGWLVHKQTAFYIEYIAIEPQDLQFAVDVFPQLSTFDYPENEEVQDYRKLCEQSGWTFATAYRQLHIFYAPKHHSMPIPIHTDAKIKAQILLKTHLKYELFPHLVLLFNFFNMLNVLRNVGHDVIFQNVFIFGLATCLLSFLIAVPNLISSALFCFRSVRFIRNDVPIPPTNRKLFQLRTKFTLCLVFPMLFLLLLVTLTEMFNHNPMFFYLIVFFTVTCSGSFFVIKQIAKKYHPRKRNKQMMLLYIILVTLFSAAFSSFMMWNVPINFESLAKNEPNKQIMLKIADFGIEKFPTSTYYRGYTSVLVPINEHYVECLHESHFFLNTVTEVRQSVSPHLADLIFRHIVEEMDYVQEMSAEELTSWGVQHGYYLDILNDPIHVVLLYGNTVLSLIYHEKWYDESKTEPLSTGTPIEMMQERTRQIIRELERDAIEDL